MTPPEDASVANALGELREAQAELRRRTLDGQPPNHTAGRIRRLQEDLRARTLRAAPTTVGKATAIDLRGLRRALGPTVLIEYIALEGQLHAVAVSDQGASLHHLGPIEQVSSEKSYLLSGLRSLLSMPAGSQSPTPRRPTVEPLTATGSRLAQLLLDPLRLDPAAALVIVPTGPLHGIPWGALRGLHGRPVTVAPSAQLWLHRAKGAPTARGDRVALVLGPGLTGAAVEISQLAESYPASRVLAGPDATVAGVLAAFERTDLIHIAAHGEFRADSPLFSSLRLVDGVLTVYDLEPIRSPPATVVLPSCEAAKTEVMMGDELFGATVALLGIGVRSVIASSLPIPDDATIPLMLALHRALRAGATPSYALARAALDLGERPVDRGIAAAFSCLGAGERATAEISE